MVQLLPLKKIDLLLVIDQRYFYDPGEWGDLDSKLASHSFRGPCDGTLRFYATMNYSSGGDDEKKWRNLLPTFMERPYVKVDRDLLNDPHRDVVSVFEGLL